MQKILVRIATTLTVVSVISYYFAIPYFSEIILFDPPSASTLYLFNPLLIAIITFVCAFLGLSMSSFMQHDHFTTKSPIIQHWKVKWNLVLLAIISGLSCGILVILFDLVIFQKSMNLRYSFFPSCSFWKELLRIPFGIVEEVVCRLFLVTLLTKWYQKIFGFSELVSKISAIGISVLIVGAMHLPDNSLLFRLTPVTISRVMSFYGITGILFGAWFVFCGVEYSAIAHMAAQLGIYMAKRL